MRGKLKVLLCDDIEERGRDAVDGIRQIWTSESERAAVEVNGLFADDLQQALVSLFDRASLILDDDYSGPDRNVVNLNDTKFFSGRYDVIILDNNLKALNFGGARFTADGIAGYVRAFTDIPYVISLNKNPEIDFDLNWLVGDRETPADVAVNQEHLESHALWTGRPEDSDDGFKPSYWPALLRVAEMRRRQAAFVESKMEASVLDSLAFPEECLQYLSRHAIARFWPIADLRGRDWSRLRDVTFWKFFLESCRSLPVREERRKLYDHGHRNKETRKVVARVVAAEIDKWFRQDVLGPQNTLVDVPHLLMRMPFLLGAAASDIDRWNHALLQSEPPYGLDEDIFSQYLVDYVFSGNVWLQNPCFWWPLLKSCEALNEMFYKNSEEDWEDAVFCEDVSMFRRASNASSNDPEEFVTELEGSWARRYIGRIEAKNYVPGSCFAI